MSTISRSQASSDEIIVRTRIFVSLDELSSQPLVLQTHGYLEGALVLMINGQPIISELEWDVLDELWDDIVNGIAKLDNGEESEWTTYFPEQSIKLSMIRKGQDCEVVLKSSHGERRALCTYAALRSALLTEGERFFRTVAPLVDEDTDFYFEMAERASAMLRQG